MRFSGTVCIVAESPERHAAFGAFSTPGLIPDSTTRIVAVLFSVDALSL